MDKQSIYLMQSALVNCHAHLLMLAMQKVREADEFIIATPIDVIKKHELNSVAKGWLNCLQELGNFTSNIIKERAN
jgi:hypothetical protein